MFLLVELELFIDSSSLLGLLQFAILANTRGLAWNSGHQRLAVVAQKVAPDAPLVEGGGHGELGGVGSLGGGLTDQESVLALGKRGFGLRFLVLVLGKGALGERRVKQLLAFESAGRFRL